jgi:molybdate/tungstate transport system substrate-binding protein
MWRSGVIWPLASLTASVVAVAGCRPGADRSDARGAGGPLLVFNAASLGPPFRALGDTLQHEGGWTLQQENTPSLDAVRKVTDLGRFPDVLATADVTLFDSLIVPQHANWYLLFGTNALVLAYGRDSPGLDSLTSEGWWRVLLRPGVRIGRSDPSTDPSGYRALMAVDLAERHYHVPGLAARLRAAMPLRYVRRAEADLSALVETGELDFIWTYRNLARAHGLQYFEPPPEVSLADPGLAKWYGQVSVRLARGQAGDSITVRGAPIVFGLTVPREAPHAHAAAPFVRLLLSPRGAAVLRATGFDVLPRPTIVGTAPAPWDTLVSGAARSE